MSNPLYDGPTMVSIVDACIVEAAARGDGAGLLPLRRRLRALTEHPPAPSTSLEIQRARVELERDFWIQAIEMLLLPTVRETLVDALADGDGDRCDGTPRRHGGPRCDGPWAELDPRARRARDRSAEAEFTQTQMSVVEACRRYEQTRKTSHLRAAVRELEESRRSFRTRSSAGLEPRAWEGEAERLGKGLTAALSPRAKGMFAGLVREELAIVIKEHRLLHRSDRDGISVQLLSRSEWTYAGDTPLGPEAACFVEGLQERFDHELEKERHRAEAEDRRRSEIERKDRARQRSRHEETESAQTEPEEGVGADSAEAVTATSAASAPEGRERAPGDRTAELQRKFPKELVRDAEKMHPAMAEAVTAELERRARWDAERARQRAEHDEYERLLMRRGWR